MAQAVAISISADAGQAKSELASLSSGMKQVGEDGEAAFQKAGSNVVQMGGHVSTGLDSVRLLSQEFGLRLPRAIESMLSRMPAVTDALSSMLGVMAGIVAVQVFVRLADEGHKLYDEYISLNAEADKFLETLQKTAQQDFASTRTIETTQRRSDSSTSQMAQMPGAAQSFHDAGISSLLQGNILGAVAGLTGAHEASHMGVEAAGDMVKLGKVQLDQTHQTALAQIELAHAMDSSLTGQKKINAEVAKKLAIDAEDRNFDRKTEMYYGNATPGDAGATEQKLKDQQAQREGDAQTIVLNRAAALAIMKSRDEVVQAGLSGEAFYVRKMADAEREITLQMQTEGKSQVEIESSVYAKKLTLADEYNQKVEQNWHRAQEASRSARQSGLTGSARVTADFGNQLDKINTDTTLDPESAHQMRIAAHEEEIRKLQDLEDKYTASMKAEADARTGTELGGFAKIEQAAQKAILARQKAYDDTFVNDGGQDIGSKTQHDALANDKASIMARARQQELQLAQQNRAEDLSYAKQAADAERHVKENGILGWEQSYRDAITAINEDDAQRTAKMQEEAAKQGLTDQEVAQRKVDIDRVANAQIAEQSHAMQDQIAGTLQQAFTDPIGTIKGQMEKMFFEIIAKWVMQMDVFKQVFGNTMGGLQPGAPGSTSGSSTTGLMSTLAHGAGGAFSGHPTDTTTNAAAGAARGDYTPTLATSGGGYSTGSATSGTNGAVFGGGSGSGGGFGGGGGIGSDISSGISALSSINGLNVQGGGSGLSIPGFGSGIPNESLDTTGVMPASFAANGEDGGFAGYMTGATDSGSLSAAMGDGASTLDPMGTAATMQASGIDAGGLGAGGAAGASQALGDVAGVGMGGYQLYQSTVSAFTSDNPLTGAMGDAAAGAAIGSIAGPEGTLIGAGAGAILGAGAGTLGFIMGESGNLAARAYYQKSVYPQLNQEANGAYGGDFQAAVKAVNDTVRNANGYMTAKFGKSSADYVDGNYMDKEQKRVLAEIENSTKGGRQFTTMSALQFHSGGRIDGFGSLATSDTEGFIHAMKEETVMTPQASRAHEGLLSALNAGASAADVASSYLAGSGSRSGSPQPGGDTHIHVHTLDTKTMSGWLKNGGAQLINSHVNKYATQYAGDGVSG